MRSSVPRSKSVLLALLLLPLLTVLGCSGYGPQTTLYPLSDFGQSLDEVFRQILWWEIGIFVVVEGALIYAVLKFRRTKPIGEPRQLHGHTGIEVAWTLAPALILIFIGVPTVYTIFRTQAPPPANALRIDVIGHQWWWEFRYPELGIVTANELHLPQGRPVHLAITSTDVLHAFWIPRLGGKRDAIPNRVNHIWFTADSTGYMPGQCAEFCGVSHANMRTWAQVDSPAEFDAWVASQLDTTRGVAAADSAAAPVDSLVAFGAELFRTPQKLCTTCHTVRGVSVGIVGPNLNKVGTRKSIASGIMPNTPEHLAKWIQNPQAHKPGALMPNIGINEREARALAAYLSSLQ